VAYHEAGHALVAALTPDYDRVEKITLIPRTNGAGGFTLFTPSEERAASGMYSKRFLEDQLAVALGGRVAEEIVFGEQEITTGASSDLQQVQNIARRMVTQWGMSSGKLGLTAWETPEGPPLGGGTNGPQTQALIDEEVRLVVGKAYENAKQKLSNNKELMDELVQMLLEKETVGFDDLEKLMWARDAKPAGEQVELTL